MKIPQKPPDWLTILKANLDSILNSKNFEMLNEFIRRVERRDEYVNWDKFKYLDIPEDMPPEHAWSYLKLTRSSKMMKTELVAQDYGHFECCIPDNFLKNLLFIDKYTSGQILVSESTVHKSERKKYLTNSLMEEAIASSQLEGAATTRKMAKSMLRSGRKPTNHAEKMIFNNYKTIINIESLVSQPLSDEVVLALHRSMTIGTLEDPKSCGRFRIKDDEPIHVRDETGQILYEPPSPDRIPSMMKILYDYANNTTEEHFTHPMIKAINLHFYLSYIHPFMDGNGRTARALFYWYMLKQRYWMFEYLTISRIFLKARIQYAQAFLYTETDDLDLTHFISFHLKAVTIAIKKLLDYIKGKQKEMEEAAYHLKKYPELNVRQRELIKNSFDNPDTHYTIDSHSKIHRITYETARRDFLYLTKIQLFDKIKKGRKFYFIPSKDLYKKIKRM